MGVYIPNMSKPKRCIEELDYGLLDNPCLFVDEREACLLQNNSKIGEYEENYKTCPLIEIDTDDPELSAFFEQLFPLLAELQRGSQVYDRSTRRKENR